MFSFTESPLNQGNILFRLFIRLFWCELPSFGPFGCRDGCFAISLKSAKKYILTVLFQKMLTWLPGHVGAISFHRADGNHSLTDDKLDK